MLLALCAGFTACEDDNDSNPVLKHPTSLVLNTPANAVNVYDLENSESVVLTTAQPDYGYTASVTYTVYFSLNGADFKALGTTSTTTTIAVPAKELNDAILEAAGDADLSAPVKVYMKITSHLTGSPELGVIESNVVELPQVQAYVPVVEVALPTELYIVGAFQASGWGNFLPLHQAYSVDGFFYTIVALEEGQNFRFATKGSWAAAFGYSQMTLDGSATTTLEDANNDDNFHFTGKTGLYTVVVKTKIANGSVNYTFTLEPAKIYLFGAAGVAADNWSWSDDNLFTDNGDGTATSPVMGGDGELRIAVDCGTDWWKTEFTIMTTDGTLFFRNCDIPSNWAADLGADYSFPAEAGKQIVLDFTTADATGSMK